MTEYNKTLDINTFKLSESNSKFLKLTGGSIEKLLGISTIRDTYKAKLKGLSTEEFAEKSLDVLNCKLTYNAAQLESIPKEGPVILVANHPHGGIDGLILNKLLTKVRPDYKIMANSILGMFPELRDNFILVNPFQKGAHNRAPLKECINHLKNGNLLATFPAGEVSHFELSTMAVTDRDWDVTIVKLARKTNATIIPVHISGGNGLLFNLAGMIHPTLRTVMLPRQMLKKGRKIDIKIGKPIKPGEVQKFKEDKELSMYLKLRTYLLNQTGKEKASAKELNTEDYAPIIQPISKNLLQKDIDNLPEKNKLLDYKEYSVFYGKIKNLPNIIREIGRLREITFRDAGEGTGKTIDLDEYDEYYHHLFIWNHDTREIAGAYRFGKVKDIVNFHGIDGLYTSKFYKYSQDFQDKVQDGLELGRSFVTKEYQRKHFSLLLLWKGITRYVFFHSPESRILFGAVSISDEFNDKSRILIKELLQEKKLKVKPRKKYKFKLKTNKNIKAICNSYSFKSLSHLSNLIKGIEDDSKDMPVLLKQYMKMGGRLFAFSEDQDFGNTLDGLIVVDLAKSPLKTLKLYLEEHAETFIKMHEK